MTNLLENTRPIWQIGYHPGAWIEGESKHKGYPGFVKIEDGGFDFNKFTELEYAVFDESGSRCKEFTSFAEYFCVPKEKYKR
jgi:hypothetical protein